MNRQRGFSLPALGLPQWAIEAVVVGLVAAALLWGAVALSKTVTGYLAGLVAEGRAAGVTAQKSADEAQRNKDLEAWSAERAALEAMVRAREQLGNKNAAQIAANREQEAKSAQEKYDGVMRDLRDGKLVLRDPGAGGGGGAPGSGAGGTVAAVGPGGDEPGGGGRLSGEAGEFLLAEAARANALITKLRSARAQLLNDRAICKP